MNVRTDRQIGRQTDRQTDRTNFTFIWGSLRLAPIKTDGSLCVLLCFLNKQITKIVNPNVPNKVCSLICKMNAILTIFDFDNDDHHILYEVTTATEASVAPRPSNVYCHQ